MLVVMAIGMVWSGSGKEFLVCCSMVLVLYDMVRYCVSCMAMMWYGVLWFGGGIVYCGNGDGNGDGNYNGNDGGNCNGI